MSMGAEPKRISPRISFKFQLANWSKYRIKLNEYLLQWNIDHPLNSSSDIEEYTTFITECINSAACETIPTAKQINSIYVPSKATKRLIKLKHQAYR
ncbi:unnamed protein product, partial [Rotaria sp. Silwood1]